MDVDKIISKMKLKDKVDLTMGASEWDTKEMKKYGIDSIMMSDGPHGLRCQRNVNNYISINASLPATCFPTAVTSGCSFDPELLYMEGKAIGEEALAYEVAIVLGPGVNIKRNPLCGRNFEYFSEDPIVAGKMGTSWINGVQSTGVGTSLKHFACNSQEYKRMNGNSIVDERAMREIYLKPFEIAVKNSQPATVMCCYNRVNDIYGSDNKWLLTDVLRNEWGFKGAVVTDWSAMNDRIEAFKAGCDINMPGKSRYMEKKVLKAVADKELDESYIDTSVKRILKLVEKRKALKKVDFNIEEHHRIAVRIAEEAMVLLKNENILPLCLNDCCLVGYMAKNIRYQGSGSSHINPTRLESLTDILDIPYYPCCDANGNTNAENLSEVKEFVKDKKNVIVVAGLPEVYESEGYDRKNLRLPEGHLNMIDAVARYNKNVVVVLLAGSAVEVPFADKVKGILYAGIAGQGAAEAIVSILSGKVNPSGKLTESWPIVYDDVISKNTFGLKTNEYKESIYVGYRYYDKADLSVRYPFGFGLSYSKFEYSNLKIDGMVVSFTLKNNSNFKGKEIVQLYVANPVGFRAVRELKDFKKIELDANQQKRVEFLLQDDYFMVYNEGFKKISGTYGIEIAANSRDVRLSGNIDVIGEEMHNSFEDSWYSNMKLSFNDEDWYRVLGRRVLEEKEAVKGGYTLNNSPLEMSKDSWIMRLVIKVMEFVVAKSNGGFVDENDPGFMMMYHCAVDCPIKSIIINAKGYISDNFGQWLVNCANGKPFKKIKK